MKTGLFILALLLAGCGHLAEDIAGNTLLEGADPGCGDSADPACPQFRDIYVADLHADSLLWARAPHQTPRRLDGRPRGHVDRPRLARGAVNLQVFAIATRTPFAHKLKTGGQCVSGRDFDPQALLNAANLNNPRTYWSARGRADYQAARFRRWVDDPALKLHPVYRAADLETPSGHVAAMLAVEGAHWLVENATQSAMTQDVAQLWAQGARMAALTHRFSNGLADSSEDCAMLRGETADEGLTARGKLALEALIARGFILDVAHASSNTIRQVAARIMQGDGPPAAGLVMSHGGVRESCEAPRNLSAADIERIVEADGLVGLGYWPEAVCWRPGDSVETAYEKIGDAFIAALKIMQGPHLAARYQARWGRPLIPIDHLALGSDFDGAVQMMFDVAGGPHLFARLRTRLCEHLRQDQPGLDCAAVDGVFGGNFRALLLRFL